MTCLHCSIDYTQTGIVSPWNNFTLAPLLRISCSVCERLAFAFKNQLSREGKPFLPAPCSQAMVASKHHSCPLDLPTAACPDDWIGYRGKCYLFSKADGTWNESQSNCSSLNASLAVIDTQKDLDFLQQYKGSPTHWIGLRRDTSQPWRWADGTEFNNRLFTVNGDGLYVYLNDRPSRSMGHTTMRWICSQPDELAKRKQNGALQALLE
ncbi:C-type lectin domain family 2 member B-like isoform X1 [Chrysemys picta bellii]|uniref:C-type lectin domain family 2 member B-like isoform X1 n=1 Tax=Chrysemys picta bellii TaxID=8478 RepID=UPI0032B2366F